MAFKITTQGTQENQTITIINLENGYYIEVFALGAIFNQYGWKNPDSSINCIDGYANPEEVNSHITDMFQSAKLSPFVCRLKDATYTFNDKKYHTGKHFDGPSAIHGLVYNELFQYTNYETNDNSASIELTHVVNGEPYGFPFPYSIKIKYTLYANGKVNIETTVTNTGKDEMPINDGWHPYFTLGEKVDNLQLTFRSKQMAVFSKALLPTGEFIDYTDFESFKSIGDLQLDNSFTIDDLESPALQLKSENEQLLLSVSPKEGYPILQIYIPPNRNSIAVENLTGLPDSFNNHIGLLSLQPNESKHFVTEYHLQQLS